MGPFFGNVTGASQYLLEQRSYRTDLDTYVWISEHTLAGLGLKLDIYFSR